MHFAKLFSRTDAPRFNISKAKSRLTIRLVVLLALSVAMLCRPVVAQENYLVSTLDSLLSLHDLATNSFIESMKAGPDAWIIVPSPNQRLAFALSSGGYLSVMDLTIGIEITRIPGVDGDNGTMSPDGKLLLVSDYSDALDIIDAAQFKVVRKVSLGSLFGQKVVPGAVIAVANRAYVFPRYGSYLATNVAVVDLTNYSVSSIALPSGYFHRSSAGVTPDGSTIALAESEYADQQFHVLLISTATNTIITDNVQTGLTTPYALVVTPNGADPSKIFGYVTTSSTGKDEVLAVDLRTNSPTYGQVLPATAVALGIYPSGMAINSDGSRLVVAGSGLTQQSPNVDIVDTGKMFTDPAHALIAEVTVDNGVIALGVCTGFFSTTPPDTAPTVSGVSGDITNDADHEIQITGGNFQQGALARFIHDLEDTKSLFCYKHVVETVFALAREAFACSTIARHSVCCSPIFSPSPWRSSSISGKAVPMAEPCC